MGATRSHRVHPDARATRNCLQRRCVRHTGRQTPEHMQAAGRTTDVDVAELSPQRLQQAISAFLVTHANAREMRRIAPAADHLGERCLIEPGIAVVEQRLRAAGGVRKPRRDDHVAQPQAGAERPGKRTEIDRAVRRQRGDGWQRRPFVAKLAVVIVFDDVAAVLAGPGDDRLPARERQSGAGRKLMRWRDIEERGRGARKLVGDETVRIDRDRHNFRASGFKGKACALVTWIFHGRGRARIEEQSRSNVDAFLNAPRHNDPADIGHDSPARRHVASDRGAQHGKSGGVRVLRQACSPAVRQRVLQQATPSLERKQTGVRTRGKEVEQQPVPTLIREVLRTDRGKRHRHRRVSPAFIGRT